MRAIRLKSTAAYMDTLEKAVYDYVAKSDIAFTLPKPTNIFVMLTHEENATQEKRVLNITHEIIHQSHKLHALEDPQANDAQEVAIEKGAVLLAQRPEWYVAVVCWLERREFKALCEAAGESGVSASSDATAKRRGR